MTRLSLILVMALLAAACALRKEFLILPLDGGEPVEVVFTSGLFASGGMLKGSSPMVAVSQAGGVR